MAIGGLGVYLEPERFAPRSELLQSGAGSLQLHMLEARPVAKGDFVLYPIQPSRRIDSSACHPNLTCKTNYPHSFTEFRYSARRLKLSLR